MVVDEVMLRALVDGELEPGLRQQVETAVANSPTLQAQVDSLRASCLPYRAAFDAQAMPPPPAALLNHVAALLAVAGAAPVRARPLVMPPAGAAVPRRAWLAVGMAASFAAGVVVPRAFGLLPDLLPSPHEPEPWVSAIAQYHALYVRETVDGATQAPSPLQSLLTGFAPQVRVRLRVPDLAAHGLTFRRAQRLGFAARPLIQLVYLPPQGRPLAVCFLAVPGPSAQPRYDGVAGQNISTWRRDELAFVVVGDLTVQALRDVVSAVQQQVLA